MHIHVYVHTLPSVCRFQHAVGGTVGQRGSVHLQHYVGISSLQREPTHIYMIGISLLHTHLAHTLLSYT